MYKALGRTTGLVSMKNELGASVDLQQRLLDTLVLPSGDYGFLAWCSPFLPPVHHAACSIPRAAPNRVQCAHHTFLRRILRGPTSTPLPALYRETRRRLCTVRWAAVVVRLWNSTIAAHAHRHQPHARRPGRQPGPAVCEREIRILAAHLCRLPGTGACQCIGAQSTAQRRRHRHRPVRAERPCLEQHGRSPHPIHRASPFSHLQALILGGRRAT